MLRPQLRAASERGLLVGVACFAIYAWLAPDYIADADNAEFATLGAVGGVPHPSGYPLYALYLRATAWLPGTAAHATALATAVLGAAAIVVLHAACRAWGARPAAASLTCAVVAAAPVVLRVHTEAEVFALDDLIAATILWLAARPPSARNVAALGLAAGLGLANHLTIALLAPVGVVAAIAGVRASPRRAAAAAIGVAGLVAGLLPYLSLLVAPDNEASWGTIGSLGDLVHHVLRLDYGSPGALANTGQPAPIAENLLELARTLGRGWLWLPLAVAAWTLARRIARGASPGDAVAPRSRWIALAAAFALCGPVLIARFDIPPSWVSVFIGTRFHVLPLLVLAIPIAVGAGDRVPERVQLVAPLAFASLAFASLGTLAHVRSPALELGVANMLQSLPQDAVVLEAEDQLYYGAAYLQLVRDERPDVTMVSWPGTALPWYQRRLAVRGIALAPGGDEVATCERVLATGRPVFVDVYQAAVVAALPSYPYGMLRRILPRGTAPPPLDEQLAHNRALFASFDLDYEPPSDDDTWAADMHRKYATTWFDLAHALAAAGRVDEAAAARATARALAPRPSS